MFRSIFNTFANCFKIPELKSRILFTLGVLGVCRLMAYIVIPGLNGTALANFFKENEQSNGGLLGMYNMFAGGAYGNCAIGALGIMPYISATIIIQLLTAVWPKLSKLAREEGGRAQIIKYGRYLTVLICLGQGLYFAAGWEHPQTIFHGFQGQLVLSNSPIWYIDSDCAHHDDRHDAAHVAGRANHRSRHGQRRVAGHHHRHRGPPAAGRYGFGGHVLSGRWR